MTTLSPEMRSSFETLSTAVELALHQNRVLRLALRMSTEHVSKLVAENSNVRRPEYWIVKAQEAIENGVKMLNL